MAEFIREVTITVEIDTNKRTESRTFSSLREASKILKNMVRAINIDDVVMYLHDGEE